MGFLLPVLAIVAVAAFSLPAFQAARQSALEVRHTQDVINGVRTLQTLERQWLITRSAADREAFTRTWQRTSALVQDNPPQQRRLQVWRDRLFRLPPQGTLAQQLQENLALAQSLVDVEDGLLAGRQGTAQQRVTAARWAVLIGLPLIAVLGAVLAVLMLRRVRRLTVPLLEATTRVQAGDLSVRIPVQGDDELSVIAAHFNDMTASLERNLQEQRSLQRTLESRVEAMVQASTAELLHLGQLGVFMQACEGPREAADVITRVAPALFPTGGSVSLLAASRNVLDRFAAWGCGEAGGTWLPEECWASRLGAAHAAAPDLHVPRCAHDHTDRASLCLPLSAQGETLGVVTLHFPDTAALRDGQALAQRFADRVSLALANLRLKETLQHQSVRDPLTGLYNRRYFEETGARELARARRQGWPLSVVMLDVDHFKTFNDVHGHAVGDMVLRRLGHVMGQQFREEDVACRYGGEEFVMLLPNCGAEAAQARAEALRSAVQEMAVMAPDSTGLTVTVSVGVTQAGPNEVELGSVVDRADQALYRAKHLGRNRVVPLPAHS
ncbi:GGDEF domain-containing protein [Deinococcus aquiradiocola]|uniref:GGDEF domain-containing protein n=1 Tax=Deinococcus aquiradiocola TaxID=393059 RepID=A0A917PGP9_9DEIO|nr:GGDEF domain-containing protein [Deinococcus aquiradiocola]